MIYACYRIRQDARIKEINTYRTEAEADAWAREETAYTPLTEEDDPDYYMKYDPPMVLVLEGEDSDTSWYGGKWNRPVAVYMRGERWDCTRESIDSPVERQ